MESVNVKVQSSQEGKEYYVYHKL
jgi:hypothetical protein